MATVSVGILLALASALEARIWNGGSLMKKQAALEPPELLALASALEARIRQRWLDFKEESDKPITATEMEAAKIKAEAEKAEVDAAAKIKAELEINEHRVR
jgi:hypothetical protein